MNDDPSSSPPAGSVTAADPLFGRSWQRAWAALGAAPPAGLDTRLLAAYAQPERQYHTLQHLHECLALLEPALPLAEHNGEVELALWFHDAIYDPRAAGNEQRSADWLAAEAAQAGLAPPVVQRLRALVLATRHDALPAGADEALLVDVDLAILGAPRERFAAYERQVRGEYAWVPEPLFRAKRRQLLTQLLARSRLFTTDAFHDRLEAAARANLAHALAQLAD